MKLSAKEQAILAAVEFDAETALTKFQRPLKLPLSTIRFTLNGLLEREIIRYYPFVNVLNLGLTPYSIFCSFMPKQNREMLIEYLKKSPQVSWLAEFSGGFQYCITVLVKSPTELNTFLHQLSDRFGNIFSRKNISSQLSFTLFQTKYLYPKNNALGYLTWERGDQSYELDELDRTILGGLLSDDYRSRRELSRQIGIGNSTIDHRINRLLERQIIQKFLFLLRPLAIHMSTFKLLVSTRGMSMKAHNQLFEFCRSHPNITTLIRCLGTWDYEIGVEVSPAADIARVVRQLHDTFSNEIADILELAQFHELKLACYPLLTRARNGTKL